MLPALERLHEWATARRRWVYVPIALAIGFVEHWFFALPLEWLGRAQEEHADVLPRVLWFISKYHEPLIWLILALVLVLWPRAKHRERAVSHAEGDGVGRDSPPITAPTSGQPSSTPPKPQIGEVEAPCRSGTIYWLGQNLAQAAYAFAIGDIDMGRLELKNACNHVKHLPLSRIFPARLEELRTLPTSTHKAQMALATELLALSKEIGRHVEGWQGEDFVKRDVVVPGGKL